MVDSREFAANFQPMKTQPRQNSAVLDTAVMTESRMGRNAWTNRAMPPEPPSMKSWGTMKAQTAKASRVLPSRVNKRILSCCFILGSPRSWSLDRIANPSIIRQEQQNCNLKF